MAIDRQALIRELERLVHSPRARAVLLEGSDAELQTTVELYRAAEADTRRVGHIASTGFGLASVALPE